MGGLTALLLASREPSPVLSFIDVRGIFESMVELSHHGDLMTKFRSLPCPRMFMYGEQNSSLSYLPTLAANGIDLAEISDSSHWPMYSNPVAMWERIAEFLTRKKLP